VLASFYTSLYSHKMSREGEDKIWWVPSNKGNFDVRSLYNILASKEAIPFPWKSVWHTCGFLHLDDGVRKDPHH
jgi:hypothetical protein